MEISDDSDDNTPLCWIDHKRDVLEEYKANELKEELDEDLINIDPELDLKPDLIQFNKEVIAIDLLKVPIIYTTKLEEMNVFKRKFDDINIQCFTERVYEESKPKYIRASFEAEQSSSHRLDCFLPSPLYCAMEKKISAMNRKCVSQNFGKLKRHYSAKKVENCPIDKKVLSKFKSVSVVLNDFRKTNDLPLQPKNYHALLVRDKQLYTVDIFITTKGSKITQHYNFVAGEPLPTELTMVRMSKYVVCCWYTREEFFLSANINFNQHNNVVRLGRMPHGCVQYKCKCCCKHKQSVVGDSANGFNLPDTVDTAMQNLKENIHNSISKISHTADTSPLNAQNNNSFKNMLSSIKPSSSHNKLILKTLSYKKPFTQKQICGLTYEKKDILKRKLIHLTNTKTNELEFYELDNDGNVCAHAQFKKRTLAHDYLLDFNKPKIIGNICCWEKRENIILKLITKHLSDSAIKLIRRPHSCFPGKCTCCCYAASIRKKKALLDISLNKGEHSLDNTASDNLPKIASVTSGKNFNDNISIVNEKMTEKGASLQKMNQTQDIQVSEQHNTVNTSSQSDLHFYNTNNLISTSDNTKQKLNQCLNVNTIIERNGSKFVESIQIAKGTIASATKQNIVTNILETFRNARLTVNNEGKVAAALNTPVNTLSTVELKVLAHILSSAQNEVNNVLKNNSSESNTAVNLSNFTQIPDRSLNTTEQNPVREVITDKKIMVTPPLTIGESLPTVVGVDKSLLSDFNYKLGLKQKQLQHSFRSFNNNLYNECNGNETTKVPQIQNVYSLNDQQKSDSQTDASSSATMWYIEPKKKESPRCSILQKRMDLMLKSDLSSSRALLKYKSLRELKHKSTHDLSDLMIYQNISEPEAPVKILNSSISDSDTKSKTPMSRYQIISSNDSKELKSPNDITLVMSNTKNKPSQIKCPPAIPTHTLPTQSNPTVINITLEGTELNTSNPRAVSVVPYFTEHPAIRLKQTRQRKKVVGDKKKHKVTSALNSGLCDNVDTSTINSQRHSTLQNINVQKWKLDKPPSLNRASNKTASQKTKTQNIDLKPKMTLPRRIAPKPMILPHDASFTIILPPDTPVISDMFSQKTNTNQQNGAEFEKSSTKIKTKSVDAINANGSGDTEAADQDVEFVIKIGDENINVKMTENVNDSARMATIADGSIINADPIVIVDDVDKNSDNKNNDDDECILGV